MRKYRFKHDPTVPNRPFVNHPPATGNLIKIRSLVYVSDEDLLLWNYIDVKIGQNEPYARFDLVQLPGLEFLKKDFLLLMEVLLDRNHQLYAFIPLNRKFIIDPEIQLRGNRFTEIAEKLHDEIADNYPFKEMVIPTIVKRYDDDFNPEVIIPDLCA